EEGTLLVDLTGTCVGQVNGLSVLEIGGYAFGKPVRITASAALGKAGLINIEREANLSGRFHDKGVHIIAGYLRSCFAKDKPLSLAASICFEQSYSGVDGDLRAAFGAVRAAAAAGHCGDGLDEPARRYTGDRRGQRKDRRILRHVPDRGVDRDAGRDDSGGKRRGPDAAGRRAGSGEEREIPYLADRARGAGSGAVDRDSRWTAQWGRRI